MRRQITSLVAAACSALHLPPQRKVGIHPSNLVSASGLYRNMPDQAIGISQLFIKECLHEQ